MLMRPSSVSEFVSRRDELADAVWSAQCADVDRCARRLRECCGTSPELVTAACLLVDVAAALMKHFSRESAIVSNITTALTSGALVIRDGALVVRTGVDSQTGSAEQLLSLSSELASLVTSVDGSSALQGTGLALRGCECRVMPFAITHKCLRAQTVYH